MPVASVGETASHEVQVTAEAIDAFAELSGDENPIHLDEAYAAETMFGGRVAHGMLSAAAACASRPAGVASPVSRQSTIRSTSSGSRS